MAKKYQTLADFVRRPFNKAPDFSRDQSYEKAYTLFVSKNLVYVKAVTVIGESYYVHIKVPSESQQKQNKSYLYDVVIRFFTDDPVVAISPNLNGYKIQFFSNSPGFIYHYAYLYKQAGYLINDLFEKIDGEYENVPPTKTNPNGVVSYDKSIYIATRFLYENRFKFLIKEGGLSSKMVSNNKFIRNINDFDDVKFDQTIISEEKKLQKEIDKNGKKGVRSKTITSAKKNAGHSTAVNAATATIRVVKKKDGSAKVVTKRKARRSTMR